MYLRCVSLLECLEWLYSVWDLIGEKGASKEHDEYEQLRLGLEDILNDLDNHYRTKSPKGARTTKSVQLICRYAGFKRLRMTKLKRNTATSKQK
jgi:hypothetical protein